MHPGRRSFQGFWRRPTRCEDGRCFVQAVGAGTIPAAGRLTPRAIASRRPHLARGPWRRFPPRVLPGPLAHGPVNTVFRGARSERGAGIFRKQRIERLPPLGQVTDQVVDRGRQVLLRVQGGAVLAHLEVQVRPGGPPRVADAADGLPLPDRIALAPDDDGQVGVRRPEPPRALEDAGPLGTPTAVALVPGFGVRRPCRPCRRGPVDRRKPSVGQPSAGEKTPAWRSPRPSPSPRPSCRR
jgi:hypothetical protein